jgi:hypothetical protein
MRTKLAYIAKSATEGVWFWSAARAETEPGHRILLLYRFNRAAAKAGAEFGEAVLCGAKHYFSSRGAGSIRRLLNIMKPFSPLTRQYRHTT